MYLCLDAQGAPLVKCPHSVTDSQIVQFVLGHQAWLKQHTASFQQRKEAAARLQSEVFIWGHAVTVRRETSERPRASFDGAALTLFLPPKSAAPEEAALIELLRRQLLLRALPPLVKKWQDVLGVHPSGWHIRNMKSRWGSCQPSTGRLCFNTRLTERDARCLEYVVVHELCHLLEANHSPAFWAHVARCIPGWKELRKLTNAVPGMEE